jgi:hypothetical protein
MGLLRKTGESGSFQRRFFTGLCILPFVLLPVLCLDAGISGDEPVHHEQAGHVHDYFSTDGEDLSAINTPLTFLKYYGQSIDNFSYRINQVLGIDEPYLVRHLVNAIAGALTVLFTGLLALEIAGYGAGIVAILFLLLSPVFLGHTYSNLKDIPFALGYLVAIFYLLKFLKGFPKIHFGYLAGIAAGTGFAISVRIGGLVIVPIVVFFSFLQSGIRLPEDDSERQRFLFKLYGGLFITLVVSYIAGLVNWPYGLQAPIRHPLESLRQMTHYIVSIRQLFEGELYWSEFLPRYYAPKYFLMVTPAIILAGIPLCWPIIRKKGVLIFSLLLFSAFFPLFWVVLVHSNLYGNIRHLLFIYPFLVVLSASGWILVFQKLRHPRYRLVLPLLLGAGLSGPLLHIIRNHPVEYVYFNKISGGIANAYHRYETDYYFHSLGPAVRWLEKEVLTKPSSDTLIIASNFPLEPFLEKRHPGVRTVYTPWFERGRYDWDYGVFVNAYLGPGGLKGKEIQPSQIVHGIYVDGFPMSLVLHRTDKRDVLGYGLFSEGKYEEAVQKLKAVTEDDPANETAWLYLGWSYRKLNITEASNAAARALLAIHPESEPARELLIWNQLGSKNFEEANRYALELFALNPKYPPAATLLAASRDSLAGVKR